MIKIRTDSDEEKIGEYKMVSSTRNDVKQLAAQIEVLAKRVQENLDGKGDFLSAANELVRNSTTMVFALGEVYAMENAKPSKAKSSVAKKAYTSRVYYRDALGRFASKV